MASNILGSAVKETDRALIHHTTVKTQWPERKEELQQIIIAPATDCTPKLPHEQTPVVEATSDGANIEENESSIKQDLYTYACSNAWDQAKSIYDKFPDMVRIPLTARGDTALHVATNKESATFVEELVKLMTPQDLKIQNRHGNTAFCMAVIARNDYFCQIMMERNENLPLIRCTQDGMLPVHLAVLSDYRTMVKDMSSENLLQKKAFEDIERLFFMTIDNGRMYDVAVKLLEKYPEQLVVARYDINKQTAFHLLAQKSSITPAEKFENNTEEDRGHGHDDQSTLLEKMCSQLQARQLEYNKIVELMTHPSIVLIDAVKSGNLEIVKQLLQMNPELMTVNDPVNGQNLLHYASLHREEKITNYVLDEMLSSYRTQIYCAVRAVDNDRNNVLHLAAHQSPAEETSSSAQIEREILWFKRWNGIVPPELKTMRNNDGRTPKDIFNAKQSAKQREFSREVKEAAEVTTNLGMVVAALVASVAFAAALTVPGDKTSPMFVIFILTNAVALFTSSVSIVSFLSILTTLRFTTMESFETSLNATLTFGLALVFISVSSMVIAFTAASFLIFDNHRSYKWVAYLVAIMGFLPTLSFIALPQYQIFYKVLRDYFFRYRMLFG